MSDETQQDVAEETIEEATEAVEVDPVAQAKREAATAKREATKIRKQLEELQAAEEQRRQAEMTELEREREKAAQLAQQLEQVQKEQEIKERAGWVREASRDAKIDPDVAAALIGLDNIETAKDAKAAMEQLAAEKPHLVMQDQQAPRVGTIGGTPPKADESPEASMANFLLGMIGKGR